MNEHFKDELQDLLSGQLSSSEASAVENHLKSCRECRQEFERLRFTKQIITNHIQKAELPADLRADITRLIDQETVTSQQLWKRLLPYAAVLILVLAGLFYYFGKRSDLHSEVTRDFRQYKNEQSLQLLTKDIHKMEQFYTGQGMPFHVTVYDLKMMKYELIGGSIHDLNGRKTAVYLYRGAGNEYLICEMYLGTPLELPEGATLRENKGKLFYIYKRNGLTSVFWPEKKVMCVLVSDIEPEKIIQVAFAKATPGK